MMGVEDQISRPDDRVKTTFVGYRDAHYKGEPKSRRQEFRLDEPLLLRPPHKIMNQSLYGKMNKS